MNILLMLAFFFAAGYVHNLEQFFDREKFGSYYVKVKNDNNMVVFLLVVAGFVALFAVH